MRAMAIHLTFLGHSGFIVEAGPDRIVLDPFLTGNSLATMGPGDVIGKTIALTHGHADHARSGHAHVMATPETLAIMETRYGEYAESTPVQHGEVMRVGEVDVSFVPAGHVLGSAQIILDHAGERVVVTGDYKRRPDPTCAPFQPVPCDLDKVPRTCMSCQGAP